AALATLLLTVSARAADEPVTLNFVNADIEAVVKAVAEMTGRNFVLDPRVKGVVNIVSARPVPVSLVYPTLLSALRLQGYAAVESNGVTKIVPEADAKQHASPVTVGPVTAGGDRPVTEVYALKNESASQLVNVLRPLITPNNSIAAVPTGNALVITDYADNLRRIERIIASLDVPAAGEPIVVPLRNASALDLVQILNRLLADSGGAPGAAPDLQQRVTVVADPRSNSVLVREVTADKAAEFGIQWNLLDPNKFNSNSTQVGGGTNFGARGTGTNIIDAQASLGSLGQGLNLGVIRGTISIPGIGTITNLAL